MLIPYNKPVLRFEYTGLTEYPVDFPFYSLTTIKCLATTNDSRAPVLINLEYGSDFTVEGVLAAGNDSPEAYSSGSVTLTTMGLNKIAESARPITALIIYRSTTAQQQFKYTELDSFPALSHENALGMTIVLIQEILEELERCIKAPLGDEATGIDYIESLLALMDEAVARAQAAADDARASAERAAAIVDPAALASGIYNIRRAWTLDEDAPSGSIITLPGPYFPTRHVLMLFYAGITCVLRGPYIEASAQYQYEEIGTDMNTTSNTVRIFFDAKAGDVFDMFVTHSGLAGEIDRIEDAIESATYAAQEAMSSATSAAASAASAAASAAAAATAVDGIDEAASLGVQQVLEATATGQQQLASNVETGLQTLATATTNGQQSITSTVTAGRQEITNATAGATTSINALIARAVSAATQAETSASEAQSAADEADDILTEIKAIQGAATYLPAYDFGKPVEATWQQVLMDYAMPFFDGRTEPPNSTFVQNLYDTHEWVYNSELQLWTDNGPGAVQKASNETLGLIRGSATGNGKAYVEEDGTITINGYAALSENVVTLQAAVAGMRPATLASVLLGEALPAGTPATIPKYIVGNNTLLVYMDGILCLRGDSASFQYAEIGALGSSSTTIQFYDTIPAGTEISIVSLMQGV